MESNHSIDYLIVSACLAFVSHKLIYLDKLLWYVTVRRSIFIKRFMIFDEVSKIIL